MWELTADNALLYLRQRGWVQDGEAQVQPLSGGVSNLVLRVTQGDRCFVLKQSCPQLRTQQAWYSDLERIYREEEVMQWLHHLLPQGIIPGVLHVDRANYVLAMEHAPLDAVPWKSQLLSGQVSPETAERAGRILGMIHERTANASEMRDRWRERKVFVQLRIDPFYRRIQERYADLAERIEPLIQEMLVREEAMCHGDFSPKNLLVYATGIMLVDHETAHLGEPAMDLGFFFSHLLLKAIRAGANAGYAEVIKAAWRGYQAEVSSWAAEERVRRGFSHLGVCLLARIDGTSPVDYLEEEAKRQAVRRLGRGLLLQPVQQWEEVLARLAEGWSGSQG